MQEYIIKYSIDCIDSLNLNIGKVKKSFNARAIHTLRLNVKKINALFSFLEMLDEGFKPKKSILKVDKLFIISGNLRDTQIQSTLLKGYKKQYPNEISSLSSYLGEKRRKTQKKFKKQLNKLGKKDFDSITKQVEKVILSIDNDTLTKSCVKFTNETLSVIKALINNDINEEKLHEIRIYLKMFIYTLYLIKKGKDLSTLDKFDMKTLNSLQQTIGDWHDHDLLYQRIRRLSVKKKRDYEILSLLEDSKKEMELKTFDALKVISTFNPIDFCITEFQKL